MNENSMNSASDGPPRHRVEIKLSEAQKAVIVKAAEISRVGVSEFVRSAAERAAREVLDKNR